MPLGIVMSLSLPKMAGCLPRELLVSLSSPQTLTYKQQEGKEWNTG
jgi:hypothetical protein